MHLVPPSLYYAKRLFRHTQPLAQAASKYWTIEPESTEFVPPAIYLEESLERITGVDPCTNIEREKIIMRGGSVTHSAITAFKIINASIIDGHLYSSKIHIPLQERRPRFKYFPLYSETREHGVLTSTLYGSKYFGHWLMDDLPLELIGNTIGESISIPRQLSEHQQQYKKLIKTKTEEFHSCFFKEMIILSDHGQGKNKIDRYNEITKRLVNLPTQKKHIGVMILRGSSGQHRLLINEDEIAQNLRNIGFRILDPLKLTAEELIQQTYGAEIVVGVEGSQLLHSIYTMSKGGALLTLQPPNRFNMVIKGWADALNLKYGFVVGHEEFDSFRITPNDVLKLIELISNKITT